MQRLQRCIIEKSSGSYLCILHTTQSGGSLWQSLHLKYQTQGQNRSCRTIQAQRMLLSSASKAVSQKAAKVWEYPCDEMEVKLRGLYLWKWIISLPELWKNYLVKVQIKERILNTPAKFGHGFVRLEVVVMLTFQEREDVGKDLGN